MQNLTEIVQKRLQYLQVIFEKGPTSPLPPLTVTRGSIQFYAYFALNVIMGEQRSPLCSETYLSRLFDTKFISVIHHFYLHDLYDFCDPHDLYDLFDQNPSDCSKAKKLICNLNKNCGFGCQIHHVVYCMAIAYGTRRTMILNSQNWTYSNLGWESVFRPVSDNCNETGGTRAELWRGELEMQDVPVVQLPIVDDLHPRPPYLPLSFPEDLAAE